MSVLEVPTLRTKGESNEWVETDRPTYLVGPPMCHDCIPKYVITDWIHPSDWATMQEVARSRGMKIPDQHLITVTWKPLNWKPKQSLELERS